MALKQVTITSLDVHDLRFPTSLQYDGSDAMHTDPDYSCAYVVLHTDSSEKGFGLTFTLGKGTEVVVAGIKTLKEFVVGKNTGEIFSDFAKYWRSITSHSQIRWIGPDKGVMSLACAGIINALWDLWARLEDKPVWRLLTDMSPETLVSTIDFTYLTNVITKEEAVQILKEKEIGKSERIEKLMKNGYPAYTTQVGWLGYSDEKVRELCLKYLHEGFTAFKIKVGQNLSDDERRCHAVRQNIGENNILMVDANQKWEVQEAVDWMKKLSQFKILWIEEPTSPDDILGHAKIAKELSGLGIAVAGGEMCANKVMFKQMLQAQAISYCQVDSCRVAGINEILPVYLMAHKFNVKVCPHAGGVGLCEMIQHLQMWDYTSLSCTDNGRWIEYVDQQHEHFKDPVRITKACYMPPQKPGYSTEMHEFTLPKFKFPEGAVWQQLFQQGLYSRPSS